MWTFSVPDIVKADKVLMELKYAYGFYFRVCLLLSYNFCVLEVYDKNISDNVPLTLHFQLLIIKRPSIKPEHGTFRNLPEHSGTSRNTKKKN